MSITADELTGLLFERLLIFGQQFITQEISSNIIEVYDKNSKTQTYRPYIATTMADYGFRVVVRGTEQELMVCQKANPLSFQI